MGWRLAVSGLPEGYQVEEEEDGLTLRNPQGQVVAEFGPLVASMEVVVRAAWDDAQSVVEDRLQSVI
ncbi:MAG: hypothetical protein ACT4P5_10805 [Armatimonadota bacterium]